MSSHLSALSAKFATLFREEELLRWRYATAQTAIQKNVTVLRYIAQAMRISLMGVFNSAALAIDQAPGDSLEAAESRHLRQALIRARSLNPRQAFQRGLLIKSTMEHWQAAKEKNDFVLVAGPLQALADSVRAEARRIAEMMGIASPYEALLRSRTPGFSMVRFEQLTADLEAFCGREYRRLQSAAGNRDKTKEFALARPTQERLRNEIFRALDLRLEEGAVKDAAHPLCFGSHDQVRVGMRYKWHDFSAMALTAAHEGGHARYRQNLPSALKDKLCGRVAGVAMDETMALLIEDHVMRTPEAAAFLAYRAGYSARAGADIYAHMTRPADKPLRGCADEVRYPLDVIVRYKIEKALIDGNMKVADIPAVWAAEYQRLTGEQIDDIDEAVLEDIHWFGAEFAWFPNYLLGKLAAAQLFETVGRDLPDLKKDIAVGDWSSLRRWLEHHIDAHGARYDSFELVERATGAPLGTAAYQRHIAARYGLPAQAGPVAGQDTRLSL